MLQASKAFLSAGRHTRRFADAQPFAQETLGTLKNHRKSTRGFHRRRCFCRSRSLPFIKSTTSPPRCARATGHTRRYRFSRNEATKKRIAERTGKRKGGATISGGAKPRVQPVVPAPPGRRECTVGNRGDPVNYNDPSGLRVESFRRPEGVPMTNLIAIGVLVSAFGRGPQSKGPKPAPIMATICSIFAEPSKYDQLVVRIRGEMISWYDVFVLEDRTCTGRLRTDDHV
jgi:hypothetical protein